MKNVKLLKKDSILEHDVEVLTFEVKVFVQKSWFDSVKEYAKIKDGQSNIEVKSAFSNIFNK